MNNTISLKEAAKICREICGLRLDQATLAAAINRSFKRLGIYENKPSVSSGTKRKLVGIRKSGWLNSLCSRPGKRSSNSLFSVDQWRGEAA